MTKKDAQDLGQEKLDNQAYEDAINEKVRLMMDPKTSPEDSTAVNGQLGSQSKTAPLVDPRQVEQTPDALTSNESPVNSDSHAEDPKTAKAVDELVAKESDDLLARADERQNRTEKTNKRGFSSRMKAKINDWWSNPKIRRTAITVAILLLAGTVTAPPSRYFLLNNLGVRSTASLVVLDGSTQQALRNVNVQLGNQSGQTDSEGRIRLEHLKLGQNKLTIKKRAFAPESHTLTLGWGSNPLGDFKLKPIGAQYSFLITDYLSGKPIQKAEAIQGDFSAYSDEQGKLKLTIEADQVDKEVEVAIVAAGYREEPVILNLESKDEIALQLVPARPHAFISKREGKYDLYKIDADGKNESLLLAGSGSERSDIVVAPHPTKNLLALVSTRENVRNEDGFLLSTLTLVDMSDGSTSKIAQSEKIQIVGWSDKQLVYVQIAAGTSAADPDRHRLISYTLDTEKSTEIAKSNYFNDVIFAKGFVYYAPSSAYTNEKVSLFKVLPDGSGKQTVYSAEVWNIYRTDYDKLVLTSGQEWYEYKMSEGRLSRLNGEPADLSSRVYVESPDRRTSLWVDSRDGKGVLLAYDQDSGSETKLIDRSGLTNPVTWLNKSSVVFRVKTESESADYVMSTEAGEPKKLRDVTNTSGVEQWYYY